jgi:hypothetical protein
VQITNYVKAVHKESVEERRKKVCITGFGWLKSNPTVLQTDYAVEHLILCVPVKATSHV